MVDMYPRMAKDMVEMTLGQELVNVAALQTGIVGVFRLPIDGIAQHMERMIQMRRLAAVGVFRMNVVDEEVGEVVVHFAMNTDSGLLHRQPGTLETRQFHVARSPNLSLMIISSVMGTSKVSGPNHVENRSNICHSP